jgi:D-alanyl-D-alanine carboxypeptidase
VATSPDGHASLDARLEEALSELLAAGAPGALALAVGPWGRLGSAAGLDSSGRPLQANARFEVGSITKTFVAALTLLLVEDGEFGLDDEVTAHLAPRHKPLGSVTVRSLLNHTSGLPDFFEDAGFVTRWRENPNRAWDPEELIEVSLALPRHEPGVFSYANSNYVLIRLVIESVTGFSLPELLHLRILDPNGLAATQLPATPTVASALVSTSDELVRFFAALLAGEIVGASSLREMLTTAPCDWAESQGYGLGIEEVNSLMGGEASPCGAAWGHVGLMSHVTTVAFNTLDASRQVVLMANAMLTSDAAWSGFRRATWAVLCPRDTSRL